MGMTRSTASNNLFLVMMMNNVNAGTCCVSFNMGLLNVGSQELNQVELSPGSALWMLHTYLQVKSEVMNLEGAA